MFTVRPGRLAVPQGAGRHEDAHPATERMKGVPLAEILPARSAGVNIRLGWRARLNYPRPSAQSGQRLERQFQRRQHQCQQ